MQITNLRIRQLFLAAAKRCLRTCNSYKSGTKEIQKSQAAPWNRMCLILFLKIHFSHIKRDTWLSSRNTNKYRITICNISENNILSIAFTISVCSASVCSGYCFMAHARCGGGRRLRVVYSGPNRAGGCACNSSVSEVAGLGLHTKISYNF